MEIFRSAETGSIRFLWIKGTDLAVSMPVLGRIRKILAMESFFVVAQDAFPNETTKLADVVLPAAIWGEKTGTFTNVDRTVHLGRKAVEPPGEARSDLDIFLEFSKRMGFRDQDGAPLIRWDTPEGAFDGCRECSKGRPCGYSGLSYAKLEGSGIWWPCDDEFPDGLERIYVDGKCNTRSDYGHDRDTGAAIEPDAHKANDPIDRAILKSVDHAPPFEEPDADYPLWLTTGRVVYHFHTRTKTGRSHDLQAAAPEAFVPMAEVDAKALGIAEGDAVVVESRRGKIQAPARIGGIISGHLFVPFHYGDHDGVDHRQVATELTLVGWDPASKQLVFKSSAVKARKLGVLGRAVGSIVGKAAIASEAKRDLASFSKPVKTHLDDHLALIRGSEEALAGSFEEAGKKHESEPDMKPILLVLASWSRQRLASLDAHVGGRKLPDRDEPRSLHEALFRGARSGGYGLLRDLQDLWLLASESHISWEILHQSSLALRDSNLIDLCDAGKASNNRQVAWLRTRIDASSPQSLVVPL